MPHEESSDIYNTLTMVLKFRETQIAETRSSLIVPFNPQDSDSVNRGQLQKIEATEKETKKAGLLFRGAKWIKNKVSS